jgi:hypothetical protein
MIVLAVGTNRPLRQPSQKMTIGDEQSKCSFCSHKYPALSLALAATMPVAFLKDN